MGLRGNRLSQRTQSVWVWKLITPLLGACGVLEAPVAPDALRTGPKSGRGQRVGGWLPGPSVPLLNLPGCVSPAGGSLTKLAYYSTVQHKVAKVRSFDHSGKVSLLGHADQRRHPAVGLGLAPVSFRACRPSAAHAHQLSLLSASGVKACPPPSAAPLPCPPAPDRSTSTYFLEVYFPQQGPCPPPDLPPTSSEHPEFCLFPG